MANKKKNEEVVEEANYGKTMLACILILIILVVGYLGYKKIYDKEVSKDDEKVEVKLTDDEKQFKKDFESLNGTSLSDGENLKKVSIIEDNNVEYISLKRATEIIKGESGVIYFAYPTDNMSRIAIPVFLKAMESTNLEKVYYVKVRENASEETDFRDFYSIEKKKAKRSKEGKDEYYTLLDLLDSNLSNYNLVNNDGKVINTGEKRLQVPTVVAVLNGKVVGFVEGTVDKHELDSNGVLRDLTNKEIEELTTKYVELITNYLNDDCDIEKKEDC